MTIVKEERIGGQRLILGDCLKVMPLLGRFDAVVTDPPYGIGESGGKSKSRCNLAAADLYDHKAWDTETLDEHVNIAISMARSSIVFGGNYYHLPPSSCWLVWDKQNGSNDFADCELAWTNLDKATRRLVWAWNGFIRKGEMDKVKTPTFRQHPTQKPLGVIEWCMGHLPADAQTILDPFTGSGTTAVAAQRMGKNCTAIELDPDYFAIACKRVDEATRQPDLLIAPPKPQPVQEGMDI